MKDDLVYLRHVLDAIDRISAYTADGEAGFASDPKTQDAVIRNLEIIGEAVKNISSTLKDSYPDTPWKRIAGMRDQLIHGYFGVKMELVWQTINVEIPRLREAVEVILNELSNDR